MVTYYRGAQPSFPTSAGGAIPDGHKVTDIRMWARNHKPMQTPLLSKIGYGPASIEDPVEWGQKARTNIQSTLNGSILAADTDFDFAPGDGVLAHKYLTIEIVDYFPNTDRLDYNTRELVWLAVDPIVDNVASVQRGVGGTTPLNHADGARLRFLNVAEPQLQTHPLGPVSRGFWLYNYWHRFGEGLIYDHATRNTRTQEFPNGDPKPFDLEEMTLRQKLYLEMTIWGGGRQAGNATNTIPSMMGGIDTFITSNVTDVGGARLSPAVLEAELRDLWKAVDNDAAKVLLMDVDTAAIFDTQLNAVRYADVNDTTASFFLDKIKFRSGTYDIGVSRHCNPGTIYIADLSKMKVIPRRNNDWKSVFVDGNMLGRKWDEFYLSGDFTFRLTDESTMAKLHGFDVDLNNYDIVA